MSVQELHTILAITIMRHIEKIPTQPALETGFGKEDVLHGEEHTYMY